MSRRYKYVMYVFFILAVFCMLVVANDISVLLMPLVVFFGSGMLHDLEVVMFQEE